MPLDKSIQKVLVIGSGPIVIGQAAEFDYAGAQACRVLKDAGINVVLCNSNPATIMTDQAMADEIYLEPLTVETVKRIIKKERPDSILAGLGGQTGLTLAMQLDKEGFLQAQGVRLLGTDAAAISRAEDRELFKEAMAEIGQPVIASDIAETVDQALAVAEKIGYPVIVRPAFTLGGAGGGAAKDPDELKIIAGTGLDASPITQILVEKAIFGWKEIEFETMRDSVGNVIAVCSMENLDPVGVHTGDSIVVAPTQTLADKEFQMLRKASLDIITHLGIVGGCNVQLALNPESFEYAVIEVNPRVSRSSALASKATGYPIAKITTKIALGYTLDEIRNDITGKTCACFEPTLDYIVVKMPKWPFDKFADASRALGTQMKATGEVMAIAPSFEMALLKAVRGAEIGMDTLNRKPDHGDDAPIRERLRRVDDHRLFTVFEALKSGVTVEEIHDITRIDPWFLCKLRKLAAFEASIADGLSEAQYREGKRLGYPDEALRRLSGGGELPEHRDAVYKMVDTCGAEFDAETPYFYSTYDRFCESRAFPRSGKPVIMVLGSGPIRIGQGIEFDYCSVHSVWAFKRLGYETIIINNNPETVSTDFDVADKLYFEPLTAEDVQNIVEQEKPWGAVVQFGGQTAIKLAKALTDMGVRILGTPADGVDAAEDRERFDEILQKCNIPRAKGRTVYTTEEALAAAHELGYPVLVRPSYVLGGQGMEIAYSDRNIEEFMRIINMTVQEHPILIDKYLMGRELEVDGVFDGEDILIPGIMEHVERAGVHSGDSIAVYPPINLEEKHRELILKHTKNMAKHLNVIGLINAQYILYNDDIYVIEVNPRSSRTIPYISKVTGVPIIDLATKVMLGEKLKDLGYGTGLYREASYFAVKAPVFSFEKLTDVDTGLGPEMKSTGEVLGLAETYPQALLKAFKGAGLKVPKRGSRIIVTVKDEDKAEMVGIARGFEEMGVEIYATSGTCDALTEAGIQCKRVNRVSQSHPNILDMIQSGTVDLIINTPTKGRKQDSDGFKIRRSAVEHSVACVTAIDTARAVLTVREQSRSEDLTPIDITKI